MTLKEYFIDELKIYLTDNFHVIIEKYRHDLCIKLCDNNGNSKNILCDITLNTDISDLKEMIMNSILDTYLYKN